MNKKLITLAVLIVCGTGFYFWWFSDSKVITRSTESLIGCFEQEAGGGRLGGAISTSTFRDLLDDQIAFKIQRDDIPYASEFGSNLTKPELVQIHSGLTQSAAIISITNKTITITDINDIAATVQLSCRVSTKNLPKNIDLPINCDLTYKKVDGDWRVSSVIVK